MGVGGGEMKSVLIVSQIEEHQAGEGEDQRVVPHGEKVECQI